MKIFLQAPDDGQYTYSSWKKGTFPGHFLYGATHFKELGIEMVIRRHRTYRNRLMKALDGARQILFCRERYDAVFATYHSGMAIPVMLRAIGLFRKRIVVWHHQPVIKSPKWWRERLGRIYYKGMDDVIFFSQKICDDSLKTGKVKPGRTHVVHWGADLCFYDRVLKECRTGKHNPDRTRRFISTGRELRDMPTLITAFNNTGLPLDIYATYNHGGVRYPEVIAAQHPKDNIRVTFVEGYQQQKLCYRVAEALCVVICCQESNYTVGLTTLVEALALGKPIICSRNPQFPFDPGKEGCGISVDYYDVKGWEEAVNYVYTHPVEAAAMGRRSRRLAEERYNDLICAGEVAAILLKTCRQNDRNK